MPLSIIGRIGLAVISAVVLGCNPLVERYNIYEGTAFGWVLIDSGRLGCPPLREAGWLRVVEIRGNRYVCTSTKVSESLNAEQFFFITKAGVVKRLHEGELIHQPVRIHKRKSHGDSCEADVLAFYFGTTESLARQPDPDLERYRPDCRTVVHARPVEH